MKKISLIIIIGLLVFPQAAFGKPNLTDGVADGDTVTVHEHPDYTGTKYGWHDEGNFDTPDYLVNRVTAAGVKPGWSIALFQDDNQQGGRACLTASDPNLIDNYFDNGALVNDNVDSISVHHNTDCSGLGLPLELSLSVDLVNPTNGTTKFTVSWLNGAPNWQVLYFNDGTEYGYYGRSGSYVIYHQYNPGNYSPYFSAMDTDRIVHTISKTISIPTPGCGINVSSENVRLYRYQSCVIVNTNDYESITEFGVYNLGLDNQISSIHFPTGKGMSARLYKGPNGTGETICRYTDAWDLSQDRWPDESPMDNSISSIKIFDNLNCQPGAIPAISLSRRFSNPNGELIAEVEWVNALDAWHVIDWGDGTEKGFPGITGKKNPRHWYSPGTYKLTFAVESQGGPLVKSTNITVKKFNCGKSLSLKRVTLFEFENCAFLNKKQFRKLRVGKFNLKNLDNKTTSIHVPNKFVAKIFSLKNFKGSRLCVTSDMWNLSIDMWPNQKPLNDTISSIKIFRAQKAPKKCGW